MEREREKERKRVCVIPVDKRDDSRRISLSYEEFCGATRVPFFKKRISF